MKRIIKFLKNWTRPTGMAGDTLMPFAEGDVALIPPSMHHHWDYNPASADEEGYCCREMSGCVISKEECDTLARYARETMGGLFANPCEMSHEDCAGSFERAYRQEIRILETRTGRW